MAVGFHRQVIMVFPDLDIVAVTTGRDNYLLSEFADSISGSVKSDTSLPADAAGAKLLADKIRDVSIERPSEVRPTSQMAAIISGKVFRFPPNDAHVKSLTLVLAGSQPHYEEAIRIDGKILRPGCEMKSVYFRTTEVELRAILRGFSGRIFNNLLHFVDCQEEIYKQARKKSEQKETKLAKIRHIPSEKAFL
jgi:hypothetical protein